MTRFAHIKNIIFDFGGVILDIDFNLSNIEFKKFGIDNLEDLYFQANKSGLFEKLEKAEILPSEFCSEIRKLSKTYVSDEQIYLAWNALLVGYKKERIELLKSIRSNYRTFLLSNTNVIHYNYYFREFRDIFGYNNFSDLFEMAYFSHQINMRKPDEEIYKYVLSENMLKPEETLFIDDSNVNIDAAKNLGIQTYILDAQNGEQLVSLFHDSKLIAKY